MSSPFNKIPYVQYVKEFLIVNNSFDQESTATSPSTNIPQHNSHHFRDTSADSSDSDEFSTTPTTPTSTSPVLGILNNNNPPNLQRRASESIAEAIQFKKLPTRRYTIPGRMNPFGLIGGSENGNRVNKFWEVGREDSSVQVAMNKSPHNIGEED
ncbi:5437_t:CDS:2 [Funneliformis caledonium]|uniref:5437_t:CDS:1 n=1 Tax=Funneliformis caledonium TaxID=1117310 RepID=A0A9N9ANU4_9GLOM|nr:5437_t:CDS:2 [Funneliformis caledonium]